MIKKEAKDVFQKAVDQTREKSPGSFDQWFSHLQFDDLTDGVLTLRARNEFVLEWVKDNFLPTISGIIREETGWSIQMNWIVDNLLSNPITKMSEPPQSRPRTCIQRTSSVPPPAVFPSSVQMIEKKDHTTFPQLTLNTQHTFSNYVVGPSNQLAYAAAIAASGGLGKKYNPLFICGGTGLGKTHLMHAIAHRFKESNRDAKILYLSAERFTNEFISAIQHHKMDDFRNRFRIQTNLLLVDDVQFLAGREQTQEEFFHTFNALHVGDKQIVLSSDKYPNQLERMEERLVSRFSWGLVADIQVPELETRIAIVRNKAEIEGIEFPDEVALFLAQRIRSNVRELEGVLIRLAAKSSLLNKKIDLAFVESEVGTSHPSREESISVDEIQRLVCHHFQLKSTDLTSKDRHRTVAFARHVAMYLCKQRLNCSFPEIGKAFGNRDHSTVISAVRKIQVQRNNDPELKTHLVELEKKLA